MTIAQRVSEELTSYADIPVGDRDVDDALEAFRAIVDQEGARRTRALVLAAVVALIAIAVGAVAGAAVLRSEPAQPARPVPDPEPVVHGSRLLVEYWSHPCWGRGGMVWVFADGRVISDDRSTYWERRLTRRGLALLQGQMGQYLGAPSDVARRHPATTRTCRHVASVVHVRGRSYDVTDNRAMVDLLFETSVLPADAWRQQEPRRYRPPAYELCTGLWQEEIDGSTPLPGRAQMLDALPGPVDELLGSKALDSSAPGSYCSILSPREARFVADRLDMVPQLGSNNGRHDFTTKDGSRAVVLVNVLLPNGESGAHGG
jgi:hypothetical protein